MIGFSMSLRLSAMVKESRQPLTPRNGYKKKLQRQLGRFPWPADAAIAIAV
jgi:hypothetical protein